MTFPVFASGDVLNASDMNAVGLWLVKTQTIGSAVSSVAVTDAFSSDYDNYLITIAGGAGSTTIELRLQLGATTTGYGSVLVLGTYASGGGNATQAVVNNGAAWGWVGSATSTSIRANIHVNSPYLTEQSGYSAAWWQNDTAGSSQGYLANTTSYTDFTVTLSAGTLTGGEIRVYGYRN